MQLASSGLPSESAELADRHRYLSAAIVEVTAPALREGHALLERVGRDEPGAQGVVSVVGIRQILFSVGRRFLAHGVNGGLICAENFHAVDSAFVFVRF